MYRTTTLLLLAGFLLSGCAKRSGSRPAADTTPAEGVNPETLKLIEAAGDQATLVVVVHPERFRPAAQTLKPLLADLKAKWKEEALGEEDLFSSAARVSGMTFSRLKLLRAWDRSRPIVAGLFEPQEGDLLVAARAVIPIGIEAFKMGPPGLRHRVLVPARFPTGLAEVFTEIAESNGLKRVEGAEKLPALKGGSLFGIPDMNGFLAFVPEQDHVRCELLTNDHPPLSGSEERLGSYAKLIQTVSRSRLPMTPALMTLASRPDLVQIYVRPWFFRDLASQHGVRQIYRALAMISPDIAPALLAQGLAEVATGYLLMSPVGAEMDDLTLGLDLDSGLRMSFMASLTERGRAIFQAGLGHSQKPPRAATTPPPIVSGWSGLDLRAALKAAPTPAALGAQKAPKDLSMQIMVCGYFCPLHYLLRNPFGLGRTALELMGPQAWDMVPGSVGFAVLELKDMQSGQAPVRAAFAALYPPKANLSFLRTGFSFPPFKTEVLIEPQEDGQLALMGVNTNPREVFNQTQSRFTHGLIGEVEMDFRAAGFGLGLAVQAPEVMAVLNQLKPVRLRSLFGGRSVQGELLVSLENNQPLGFGDLIDTASMSWDSPGAKEADTPGKRCLEQLTRDMIEGFKALAAVSPDFKTVILQRAFEESKPSLDCAAEQPDTRDIAQRIRYAQSIYLAGQFAQRFMPERGLAILDRTCKQGSAQACELAKETRATPGVRLARVAAECLQGQAPGEAAIHLRPGKEPLGGGYERHGTYQLAVDREVTYQRLMDLINQLVERGHGHADLLVRTANDQVRRIPVKLPAPKGQVKPRRVGAIRVGVAKDGTSFIGLGSGAFKTHKDLTGATGHLAALSSQEQGGKDMDFRAQPETPMEKMASLLAAAICIQDPETREPLYLSNPTAKPSEIKSKGSLLGLIGKGSGSGIGSGRGGYKGHGSISRQAIRKVMKKNQNQIRYCYEKSLLRDPKLAGSVRVKFVIAPSGLVVKATITNSTVKNKEMEECLLRRVKTFQFPKVKGGNAIVTYPFVFKSK